MKKGICVFVLSLLLVFGTTAQAASIPTIAGQFSGIELCPQFICGVAIFAGGYHGQIGNNPNASGVIVTALKHGVLPTEVTDPPTPITGGVWQLSTLTRQFKGVVVQGQIVYIGNNQFRVTALLAITSGGAGTLFFAGTLDHNPLIPTIGGSLQ